jgi:Uma2 family endonuclease
MAAIPLRRDDVYYPESDGKPMGETQFHAEAIGYLRDVLQRWYREEPNVYAWGDLFLYYREGDPRSVVCPDVFAVHGVPKEPPRRIYKLWEEGKVPSLVIEVTSASTRREDLRDKKSLYERLGVQEYILFDPLDEYLEPQLQGFLLIDGRYEPVTPAPDGSLTSRTTGLIFRAEGPRIQAIDPASGTPFLRSLELFDRLLHEEAARREAETARWEAEAGRWKAETARREAEERAAALEEELARLRRELGEP